MDFVESIQVQSLLAVIAERDSDYLLRRIFRWYSITYHTPLHEVELLPIDFVLTHYFEYAFEQMPKSERTKLAKKLTETDEEKAERLKGEKEQSDEEFEKQIKKEERKKKRIRNKKLKAADARREMEEAKDLLAQAAKATAKVAEKLGAPPAPPVEQMPEINMKFNDNLIDEETDSLFGSPSQSRKK